MILALFKRMFWLLALGAIIAYVFSIYSPSILKVPTDDKNQILSACNSGNGQGICASKKIEKGESIGLVAKVNSSIANEPVFTKYGKLIRKDIDVNNIDLLPLYIDKDRIDFYGYAKRNINEGDEVISAGVI